MICENVLITEGSLQNVLQDDIKKGFSLNVRMPFYRSFPLSCLFDIALLVDAKPVNMEDLTFELKEKEYKIAALSEQTGVWWGMFDEAKLIVKKEGGLETGEHNIDLTIRVRFPYIPNAINDDRPALYMSHKSKSLFI